MHLSPISPHTGSTEEQLSSYQASGHASPDVASPTSGSVIASDHSWLISDVWFASGLLDGPQSWPSTPVVVSGITAYRTAVPSGIRASP